MLSSFKFVLDCFSKIFHYNYCLALNTSYYFCPSHVIMSPCPQKIYDQEKFPSSSCYQDHPPPPATPKLQIILNFLPPPHPHPMLLNPQTLLGTGEYITWILSRYNCGRLNITLLKQEYRIFVLQDNNTSHIATNFCEKLLPNFCGYLLPLNQLKRFISIFSYILISSSPTFALLREKIQIQSQSYFQQGGKRKKQ